jgi:sec-independent protein translocase protein TatA
VILFGATRLPALGRSFGEAIRNFKKSTSGPEEIESTPGVAAGEKDQASGT